MDKRTLVLLNSLRENARTTSKNIAKKLRLSQQATNHRLHKLEDNGVIQDYTTIFDGAKFGLGIYTVLVRFKKFNDDRINSFINELNSHPDVIRIEELRYKWDLMVFFSCPNASRFNKDIRKIYQDNSDLLKDFEIMQSIVSYWFKHKLRRKGKREMRDYHILYGDRDIVNISDLDLQVVEQLLENGKKSALQMAEDLDCSPQTVINAMKRLKEKKIIHGYTTHLDLEKTGFGKHFLLLDFKVFHANYPKSVGFCKINPFVASVHRLFGSWQLMMEIVTPDMESCLGVVKDFQRQSAPLLNGFELISSQKCIKQKFLPESLFE